MGGNASMASIAKEDVSAIAVKPAFERRFSSKLPTEQELENAALDPSRLADREADRFAAFLQEDAVALAQAVQVLSVNRGFGAFASLTDSPLKAARKLVSQATYDADRLVDALVSRGVSSVIDGLVSSAGSVPFVGIAAGAIWSAVQLVYTFAGPGYREQRPPLFQMSPQKDSDETSDALAVLSDSSDWTGLFLPRTQGANAGGALPGAHDWQESEREGGWQFIRPVIEDGPKRFGCAPGTIDYVDAGVQSRVTTDEATLPAKGKPRYIDVLRAGKNLQAARDLTFGLGAWLPSLSALARATWATVGQSNGTALFQVDAKRVRDEWSAWNDGMVAWRQFLQSVHGLSYDARLPDLGDSARRRHIAIFLARVGAAHHDRTDITALSQLRSSITNGRANAGDAVGKRAVEHAKQLLKRQRAAIRTPLAALVSADAPAFASNPTLREKLLVERARLLAAGKFDELELDEVVDPNLRQRIRDRLEQRSNRTSPGAAERRANKRKLEAYLIRSQVPRPLDFERPAEGGVGGLLALLGVGLIAAGGYAATRK